MGPQIRAMPGQESMARIVSRMRFHARPLWLRFRATGQAHSWLRCARQPHTALVRFSPSGYPGVATAPDALQVGATLIRHKDQQRKMPRGRGAAPGYS
jgi:hypothetical protein